MKQPIESRFWNKILSSNTGCWLWGAAFAKNGYLYVPRRGILQLLSGDYIGVDSAGWPILISAYSIANAAWTQS